MRRPPLISYGHAPAIRRATVRRIIVATIVLTIAVIVYRYREWAYTEVWFLNQERRWKNCTIDEHQVVFDSANTVPKPPDPFDSTLTRRIVGYIPEPRRNLYNFANADYSGTLFLHKRTSKLGHERIINIDIHGLYFIYPNTVHRSMWLSCFVDDVRYSPPRMGEGSVRPCHIDSNAMGHMRFFGGQPDGVDQSHFIIKYDYDGRAGVVDGYLGDDDIIRLFVNGKDVTTADTSRGWTP